MIDEEAMTGYLKRKEECSSYNIYKQNLWLLLNIVLEKLDTMMDIAIEHCVADVD